MIIGNMKTGSEKTWLYKMPAPHTEWNQPGFTPSNNLSGGSIYLSATYWSYMTTTHIGVGDISAINLLEKLYTIILAFTSTFIFAFLFGNLVSLVDDIVPHY